MKLCIREKGHTFQIPLPTGLLCNRMLLRILLVAARANGADLRGFAPDAASRLTRELKQIKKRQGGWTLAEVITVKGTYITLIL